MAAMRSPRISHSRAFRSIRSVENGDRAGPAGGPGADFYRKTRDLEAGRRQLLQIVQLLDMAIADLAAGLVAFPDQARVAGLGAFLRRVHERRMPGHGGGSRPT